MTWNQYHQTVAQAMNAPEPELVHMPTDLLFEIAPKAADATREVSSTRNHSHTEFGCQNK